MANVSRPRSVVTSTPNTVKKILEANVYVVQHTDNGGRLTCSMVYAFGRTKDGKRGVYVFADEKAMSKNMGQAPSFLAEHVRRMEGEGDAPAEEVNTQDDAVDSDILPMIGG